MTHAWRGLALLGLGGFAVLNPGDVARGLVVVLGVLVLYLALTEGSRAPPRRIRSEPGRAGVAWSQRSRGGLTVPSQFPHHQLQE